MNKTNISYHKSVAWNQIVTNEVSFGYEIMLQILSNGILLHKTKRLCSMNDVRVVTADISKFVNVTFILEDCVTVVTRLKFHYNMSLYY